MTNSRYHKSSLRGQTNRSGINSYHSFSFSGFYDPDQMNFGALRVLNDDIIGKGKGFQMHSHENMEIITIPYSGSLEHQDSMGNTSVIKSGDIQVMSAGSGVKHSEYNHSKDKIVELLQIWIYPNQQNVQPRYEQMTLNSSNSKNQLHQILSPSPDDEGVWIHQDAWFHIGIFDSNQEINYTLKKGNNGIYLFVIHGSFITNQYMLNERDGYGIWDIEQLQIKSKSEDAKLLVMEVPMKF